MKLLASDVGARLADVGCMRSLFGVVDALQGAMTYHRDRHSVLAGNLANVNTPGYQPRDVRRFVVDGEAGQLATTDARHLGGGNDADGVTESFTDPAPNPGADGNAVNLEREMAKIAANRVRYATASELTSRRLALLRYGAGDGT